MPTSFQAALVVIVALVPGALYIWSFERIAGRWGIGLSDRLFRFVGASAMIHTLCLPVTYWLWSSQWPRVLARDDPSWWLWAVVAAYVAGPLFAGTAVGHATRDARRWARWLTGPDPAPRAWDYLFQGERDGWIRLKLKSGAWVGGGYATSTTGLKSYTTVRWSSSRVACSYGGKKSSTLNSSTRRRRMWPQEPVWAQAGCAP